VTCAACGGPLPKGRRRFCSDLCRVRGRRQERRYDTDEFTAMITRMIRNLGRRVGRSDTVAFGALWKVRGTADEACATATDGLRRAGFSWTEIGAAAGQSGQGIGQWHRRRSGTNEPFQEVAP
jgi:predicted nucleic acid-binding Zn ribbon protein